MVPLAEKQKDLKMDVASTENASIEQDEEMVEIELFNFGNAPFQVIQRFQDFCMSYTTLSDALIGIMQRETMLTKKYHFITAPVVYQMLAKPTIKDDDAVLLQTIDLLKKYTRRGRYDSVANAIEELLFSPCVSGTILCDKGTWTKGNIGTNYTELSENEQTVLEKIADALLFKLSSVSPETKKRKSVVKKELKTSPKQGKKRKSDEAKKLSPSKEPKRKESLVETASQSVFRVAKPSSTHLCPVSQILKPNPHKDPIDALVAVPIKNYLPENSSKVKTKKKSHKIKNISAMKKEQFLQGFFNLHPAL